MTTDGMYRNAQNMVVAKLVQFSAVSCLCLLLGAPIQALSGHRHGAQWKLVESSTGLCATFVRKLGSYKCQEYEVRTGSGYLLGVQQLRSGRYSEGQAPPKGPALLFHGIMQGADIWVMNPHGQSLGFLMADAGYDVYLGNARSSNYSFGHMLYSRNDKKFWDWGFDDLVAEDLPTMLRFVHTMTNAKIHYVGYSQGTMTAFAALGSSKEMAGLVAKAAMLSPVAYVRHVQSKLAIAAAWLYVDDVLEAAGVYEFSAYSELVRRIANVACRGENCYPDVVTALTGPNCCLNATSYSHYTKYQLQSTSLKNVQHLAQLLRSGRFGKFDYGFLGNLQGYGSFTPPSYYLSAIPPTLPILLAHGGQDDLADLDDVAHLIKELRGTPQVLYLPDYAHGDFILGLNVGPQVYTRLLTFFSS